MERNLGFLRQLMGSKHQFLVAPLFSMPLNLTVCQLTEPFASDEVLHVAIALDVMIAACALVLIVIVVRTPQIRTMPVHPNLKILLGYMLISYFVVATCMVLWHGRYLVLFHTFTSPCDLVVPAWLNALVREITYSYATGFPLWHLAVTLERMLATRHASDYEKFGRFFGFSASLLVWTVAHGHTAYMIYNAYQDPIFRGGHPYVGLTTKNNLVYLQWRGYILIALDVGTLAVDAATAFANKHRMGRIAPEYSLARSYQISENVAVTMGLILPLDVCNAVLYLISRGSEAVFRNIGIASTVRLSTLLELAFTIVVFQLPVSLLIVLRFCKNLKRSAVIVDRQAEGETFFDQFRKQINAPVVGLAR